MDSISRIVKRLQENRRQLSEARVDYEGLSTSEIVKLYQSGDGYALEYLLQEYKSLIKQVAAKFFYSNPGAGDKEDLEQVATIGFWEAADAYDESKSGEFGAFAGMIMKRKLQDEIRKLDTQKRMINDLANSIDDTLSGDEESNTIGDTLADKGLSPEEAYLGKEGAEEFLQFMKDNFSQLERDVVRKYIQGKSISEIAEEMDLKYKSIDNALRRIKNKLHDYQVSKRSYNESKKRKKDFLDKALAEKIITRLSTSADEEFTIGKIDVLREGESIYIDHKLYNLSDIEELAEMYVDKSEVYFTEEEKKVLESVIAKIDK